MTIYVLYIYLGVAPSVEIIVIPLEKTVFKFYLF